MAKKETTKKNTTKKVTKKATAAKTVKNEVKEEVIEIPTVQVVNGDPAVLEPIGQAEYASTETEPDGPYSIDPVTEELVPAEPLREKQEEIKPAKKKEDENPHEFTSLVAEEIVNESQPEEYDAAKPAKKKIENNHKPSKVKRIFGYFWNGQEMDY